MKRSFWLMGAIIGFLTSLVAMAISYLGNIWVGLPFFPFDLFDWLTRHLPGSIIEFVLRSMIALITALHLGPTASTAKLAEQVQALALVAATGIVFGLVLVWMRQKHKDRLWTAAQIGGGLLWLGMAVVEFSLPSAPVAGIFMGLIWLLILLEGWGWQLARFLLIFTPEPVRVAAIEPEQPSEIHPTALDKKITRRNMLGLLGASLVSAILLLTGLAKFRQTGSIGSSTETAAGPSVPTPIPHQIPFGPEYTSGAAASPSPAVLAARIEPAPGTRPEIDTPAQFYRVDINMIPPNVDAATWRLNLTGLVQNPLSLTLDEIWARPSVSQAVTLSCVSNPVGGDLIGSNYWTGLRFKDILAEAGVQAGAQEIAINSQDGFYEGLPLSEAMDERTLLVYAMNGQPLTVEHGFPLRLYAPGHYGMKLPKWITAMKVTNQPESGYWVDRGWSATAIPQTTSVIDTTTVNANDLKATGILPLGGIAWAGDRGISKVEVQIDNDPWLAAELRSPAISPLTWIQWRYDWKPAPGRHVIQVRATDGAGALQVATFSEPQPEGATGIDNVMINI